MKLYLTPSEITELMYKRDKRAGTIAVEISVYTECKNCNSDYLAPLDEKKTWPTGENMGKGTY